MIQSSNEGGSAPLLPAASVPGAPPAEGSSGRFTPRRRALFILATVTLASAVAILVACVAARQQPAPSNTLVDSSARDLFVFRDAGEALGLLPVFKRLGSRALGVIIPHGTAPVSLASEDRIYTLAQVLGRGYADDPALAERNTELHAAALEAVLNAAPHLERLIVGLVAAPQLQLAALAVGGGAGRNLVRVIGFDDGVGLTAWDNATVPASSLWGGNVALRRGLLDALWVSAKVILDRALASTFMREGRVQPIRRLRGPTEIVLTGSPALSTTWPDSVREAGQRGLRALRQRLLQGDSESVVMVHVFGGYDDPGGSPPSHSYADSIRVLARSAANLSSAILAQDGHHSVRLTFSPHPGAAHTGRVEREIFIQEGVPAQDLVIVSDAASPLLAAAANVTLSHFSTCGLQSLFVGTPHVFFSSPGTPPWDSIGSASGLIATASDEATIVNEILRTEFRFDPARLDGAGIPRNATRRMARRLDA